MYLLLKKMNYQINCTIEYINIIFGKRLPVKIVKICAHVSNELIQQKPSIIVQIFLKKLTLFLKSKIKEQNNYNEQKLLFI